VLERLPRLREETRPSGASEVNLRLLLAFDAMEAGDASTSSTGVARAQALEAVRRHGALEQPEPGILPAALTVLVAVDALAEAVSAADEAITAARARHLLVQVGEAATFRAMAHHRAGRLAESEADARLAHGLAREIQSVPARRHTLTWLLRCLVERGQLEEAEKALDEAEPQRMMPYLAEARGHLRAAQGRYADALAEFTAAGARARVQLRHPALVTWQPAAALALHHLGRDDEARREADAAVTTARRYASDRALGLALRARGLVSAVEADLREAVHTLARTPARLDHAHALVDLGAALRRGNTRSEARSCLEEGMDHAAACGADALVARAAQELAALGARPRRAARTGPDALTPSERRIVTLAVDGLTNRTIAQHLFITTKTVETHLAAAYRKLGVGGRSELPRQLGTAVVTRDIGGRAGP
jgi:DNA-binding NarL/FixJ family response regulator